jgi:tetratricopeptide (TPR) repeat protein
LTAGHAAVVSGFDDRRELFFTEDPNWINGWGSLSYRRVEGCFAFLVAPTRLIGPALERLTGVNEAALVWEARQLTRQYATEDAEFVLSRLLAPGVSTTSWPLDGLSSCARERGDLDRALEALERAVRRPPQANATSAWCDLGWLQMEVNEAEACVSCERALEIHPSNYEALIGKGWTVVRYDPEQGLQLSERAIDLVEDDPAAHLLRAYSLWGLGREVEAEIAMDRSAELEEVAAKEANWGGDVSE